MKDRTKVLSVYFGFCGLLALFFIFTAGGSASDSQQSKEDAALAALTGGGVPRTQSHQEGGSVFDSEFWRAGEPDKPIEDKAEAARSSGDGDNEILEPANANNPVNPQTGQPFSDAVMEQFDTLRQRFPGNSIIPKRMTAEEKQAEDAQRQQVYALQSTIVQGKATPDQVTQYYDFQAKPIKDRLELLEYVLKEQGDRMSPEIKEQYEKILDMNKRQLSSFEESRRRAISGGGAP